MSQVLKPNVVKLIKEKKERKALKKQVKVDEEWATRIPPNWLQREEVSDSPTKSVPRVTTFSDYLVNKESGSSSDKTNKMVNARSRILGSICGTLHKFVQEEDKLECAVTKQRNAIRKVEEKMEQEKRERKEAQKSSNGKLKQNKFEPCSQDEREKERQKADLLVSLQEMTSTKVSGRRAAESSVPVQGRKLKTHQPTRTRSNTNCIFFSAGKCKRGENCSFQHLNLKDSVKKIVVECCKESTSEKLGKSLFSISLSGEPQVEMRQKENGSEVLDEKSTQIELKQKKGSVIEKLIQLEMNQREMGIVVFDEKSMHVEMKQKETENLVLDERSHFVQGILSVRPKLVKKK